MFYVSHYGSYFADMDVFCGEALNIYERKQYNRCDISVLEKHNKNLTEHSCYSFKIKYNQMGALFMFFRVNCHIVLCFMMFLS